ncbi:SH3 domain-containing protein [bacterium]|nr:SH3 domain-containing protein [bacterium]
MQHSSSTLAALLRESEDNRYQEDTKRTVYEAGSQSLRKRALTLLPWGITVVLLIGIIVQYWHYQQSPYYVGIPLRGESEIGGEEENEAKFQQMAQVLKLLVKEVKKQGVAIDALSKSKESVPISFNRRKEQNPAEFSYKTGTITTHNAHVRVAPSIKSASLMTLRQGTELLINGEQEGWNRVITPTGKTAWVSSQVIRISKDKSYGK